MALSISLKIDNRVLNKRIVAPLFQMANQLQFAITNLCSMKFQQKIRSEMLQLILVLFRNISYSI